MLVSEHVAYTALIDWHSLLLCEVHGLFLMLVAVLDGEIFGFRNLSELFLEGIIDNKIHHSCLHFFAVNATLSALALDQMNQSTLFLSVKWSHNGLEFAEFLFLSLVGLILCFANKVELVDEFFELWGVGVNVFEEICVQVLFKVELGNFGLVVDHDASICVPVLSSQFFENLHLDLTSSRLRRLLSFSKEEGERKEFFLVRWVQVKLVNCRLVLTQARSNAILDVLI